MDNEQGKVTLKKGVTCVTFVTFVTSRIPLLRDI